MRREGEKSPEEAESAVNVRQEVSKMCFRSLICSC